MALTSGEIERQTQLVSAVRRIAGALEKIADALACIAEPEAFDDPPSSVPVYGEAALDGDEELADAQARERGDLCHEC